MREGAVSVHALGEDTHARQLRRLGKEVHGLRVDLQGYAAALGQLQTMAQEAEARHVRAGVDPVLDHDVPGGLVQGGHKPIDPGHDRRGDQLRLGGGGQDPQPQGLREKKHVPGPGPGVGEHLVRADKAGDGQAVFGLIVQNAMTSCNQSSGFIHFVIAPPE